MTSSECESVAGIICGVRNNDPALISLSFKYINDPLDDTILTQLSDALKVNYYVRELLLKYAFFEDSTEVGFRALCTALSTNTSVRKLDISSIKLDKSWVCALSELLANNRYLQQLKMSFSGIESPDYVHIFTALRSNASLKKLNIGYNERTLTPVELTALSDMLAHNSSLEELDIRFSHLGYYEIYTIAEGLDRNTSLSFLNLGDNNIGDEGCKSLAAAIVSRSIRLLKVGKVRDMKLVLSFAKISYLGWFHLARALCYMTELILRNNKIGNRGASFLAKYLKRNTFLVKPNLRNSNIELQGISDKYMRVDNSLVRLDLSRCEIKTEGAVALAGGIAQNRGLIHLDLSENPDMDNEGILAISQALTANSTLEYLNLARNGIDDNGGANIGHGLSKNMALRSLDLSFNFIGDRGAKSISAGLKSNISLETLSLSVCSTIENYGIRSLAICLTTNSTLKKLRLRKTGMSSQGMLYLARALRRNSTLTYLDITDTYFDKKALMTMVNTLSLNPFLLTLKITSYPFFKAEIEEAKKYLERNRRNKDNRDTTFVELLLKTRL